MGSTPTSGTIRLAFCPIAHGALSGSTRDQSKGTIPLWPPVGHLHAGRSRSPSRARWDTPCPAYNCGMGFDDYKVVLYRQDDGSWVADIPAVGGCYALMDTARPPWQN